MSLSWCHWWLNFFIWFFHLDLERWKTRSQNQVSISSNFHFYSPKVDMQRASTVSRIFIVAQSIHVYTEIRDSMFLEIYLVLGQYFMSNHKLWWALLKCLPLCWNTGNIWEAGCGLNCWLNCIKKYTMLSETYWIYTNCYLLVVDSHITTIDHNFSPSPFCLVGLI